MRVIHFPTSVTGNAYGLSRGERAIGLASDCLVTDGNPCGYPADRELRFRAGNGRATVAANYLRLGVEMARLVSTYDVFCCNFGQSLLPSLADLPLYAARGRLFVTFNGCDARQRDRVLATDPVSACASPFCYGGLCLDGAHDRAVRERIAQVDAHADGIFALTPDLLRFLPARAQYLPQTIPTWDRLRPVYLEEVPERIVIAHAPSDRGAKGTTSVLQALYDLEDEFPDRVEVLLIEGVSNGEALTMLSRAHLLVDQVLIGWYGAVAVEAMRMGIPVLAYLSEIALAHAPREMAGECRDAVVSADPEALPRTLAGIVDDPDRLLDLSDRAQVYVNRWHNPVAVASITRACYEEA
jgi:hypothetical protein